jgi:hypothetical protein
MLIMLIFSLKCKEKKNILYKKIKVLERFILSFQHFGIKKRGSIPPLLYTQTISVFEDTRMVGHHHLQYLMPLPEQVLLLLVLPPKYLTRNRSYLPLLV